jgi:plasmid stabilization system protein ParE
LKVRYTPVAVADLRKALAYIEKQSPRGARKVQAAFSGSSTSRSTTPDVGARTHSKRLRRLIARPYPSLIFYEVADDDIIIHGVRHSARKPSSMPD